MTPLPDYEDLELLGGGMSRVYRATRQADGRVIALKSVGLSSDEVVRAEQRGAELQRQFHVVEARVPDVYAVHQRQGQLLIEMEYVDGQDLSALIHSNARLSCGDAARIASGLADVLDRAHSFTASFGEETYLGIVHGDLKPRNVRVVDGGASLETRIRVLDFGVAKGIRGAAGETRNVFGSAAYMSPERLRDGTVSPSSDCWSLGIVLYEMLAGEAPFRGSEREVLHQIETLAPVFPPDCPDDLSAICRRLLADDPRERLSAAAARDELARWLDGTRRTSPVPPIPWTPPRVESAPASELSVPTRRTSPTPAARKPRWLRRALVAGLALWVVWNAGREIRVWQESGTLGRRVYAAEPDALDGMWRTYVALDERSAWRVGIWPARTPLRTALVQHVDRVIADFRRPEPTVREAQWKQARGWAASALELGGGERVRARFLVCDGHVKRIDGDASQRRGQADRARRLLNDAISQFEEAARLDRASVDPWMGLLRIYSATRQDAGAAQKVLNEAVRRGYTAAPRDYVLIGDATRAQAENMEHECGGLRTADLERDCLKKTRDEFTRAVEWYEKAVSHPAAPKGRSAAERGLARVEDRLAMIDRSPFPFSILEPLLKQSLESRADTSQ